MRGTSLALAVLFGGCIVEHHQDPVVDPDPTPVAQPRICVADVTLDGSSGSSAPTTIGPFTLDSNGVNVCLHLDATHNLVAAHFGAETQYASGTTSPFSATLEDPTYAPLQDGWDVTVDGTPPHTMTNLEWDAPLHQMTDAMLWVRAQGASASTQVALSLFEPLED